MAAIEEKKIYRWGTDGEEIFIEVWKIWWTRITRRSKATRGCFLWQQQHSVQKEHYKANLKRIISSLDMVEKWAADDSNSFTQWFICNNQSTFVTAPLRSTISYCHKIALLTFICHHSIVQFFQLIWRHSAFKIWILCPISMLGVLPQPFLMIVSIIFYWSVSQQIGVYEVYPENLYIYFLQSYFMIEGNENWLLHLCSYLWSSFW